MRSRSNIFGASPAVKEGWVRRTSISFDSRVPRRLRSVKLTRLDTSFRRALFGARHPPYRLPLVSSSVSKKRYTKDLHSKHPFPLWESSSRALQNTSAQFFAEE